MKFMVFVKANKQTESGELLSEQFMSEIGAYNEKLADAGIMLAAEGLHPSSEGVRFHFSNKDKKIEVTDGPFTESKELIAGYWIWQVKSKQEAIDWIHRMPNCGGDETDIELRRIFDLDELAPAFTPELQAREDRLQSQLKQRSQ